MRSKDAGDAARAIEDASAYDNMDFEPSKSLPDLLRYLNHDLIYYQAPDPMELRLPSMADFISLFSSGSILSA